jgi:dihydropteroate synthase
MRRAELGGVVVGEGCEVAVMAAINLSPESFYGGSVTIGRDRLLRAARAAVAAGAALVDLGARSSAPYGRDEVSEAEETDRLARAVETLVRELPVPLSADTCRLGPARAALEAGARILNDVTGLLGEPALADLAGRWDAGLIVMAAPRGPVRSEEPIEEVARLLEESLAVARRAGVRPERIAVDPGIGFFRDGGLPWHEWDCRVLARLGRLQALGRPLAVGVSRKSFIGAVAGVDDPAGRLPGSLAATGAAVLAGADLVRAHDVAETVQAVRVAAAIRRARGARRADSRAGAGPGGRR